MTPLDLTENEQLTALVYGDTFSLYDPAEFETFVHVFRRRLAANDIPLSSFEGKRCLDAGCGGGRGSILMAEAGAAEVVGADLSEANIASATKRAEQRGLTNCSFQLVSLAELPFEDESFDVVWCNGVLHHSTDPDAGLREITRVLKTGGPMWLYLYGSGGIYWYVMDWIRDVLKGTDAGEAIRVLRLLDVSVDRIGEWIDDWYTPYLRRYTDQDVKSRLAELGFADVDVLTSGLGYDTSQRLAGASDDERRLMGEGDLRYWARKSGEPTSQDHVLPDPPGGLGSAFEDPQIVTQIAAPLDELRKKLEGIIDPSSSGLFERLAVCRAVHTTVRDQLETPEPLDPAVLLERIDHVASLVDGLQGRQAEATSSSS